MMRNVIDFLPTCKTYRAEPGFERLSRAFDLAEVERAAWLTFRITRHAFLKSRSLSDEIAMIDARDVWDQVFRQVE